MHPPHPPPKSATAHDYNCLEIWYKFQRWGRGHKARGEGQGHGPWPRNPRPWTDFPRTDPLEAKNRWNARRQGQGHNAQDVFYKKKVFGQKIVNFPWNFRRRKKRSWPGFIFNRSKNSALLGRRQGIFEDLKVSRPRPKTYPSRPGTSMTYC